MNWDIKYAFRALMVGSFAAFSAVTFAQDTAPKDEPFDPYKAYQENKTSADIDTVPPPTIEPETKAAIIRPAPMQGMTQEESDAWMAKVQKQSHNEAKADTVGTPDETFSLDKLEVLAEEARVSADADKPPVDATKEEDATSIEDSVPESIAITPESSKASAQIDPSVDIETLPEEGQDVPAVDIPDTDIADTSTDSSDDIPEVDIKPTSHDSKIAPFYLSAQQYLAQRGGTPQDMLTLTYEVALDGSEAPPSIVTLALTQDYAAITPYRDDVARETKIYDFKYNRLLRVKFGKEGNEDSFTNTALFADVHRKTSTIGKMTAKGTKDQVSLAPGVQTDAFWAEAAMGWAAQDRRDDIVTEPTDNGVTVNYKNEPVLTLEFDDTPYPEVNLSDTMLVFAHHNLPIHPSLLRQLYAAPAPLKSLTMRTVTPGSPQGQSAIWTLKDRSYEKAAFPLPPNASSALDGPSVNPVAFIINETANDRALGGAPDIAELADNVTKLMDSGDLTEAWLAGQRYISHAGGCERGKICTRIHAIEARPDLSPELTTLIAAFKDAKSSATRVRALKALRPWLEDQDSPAIIIRTIAMTRARIRTSTAKAALLGDIEVEPLLIAALAKDPYDPETYIGLAQYYAANGNFEAAWDMHDAMRSAVPAAQNRDQLIDGVEIKLRDTAPGFFLPDL